MDGRCCVSVSFYGLKHREVPYLRGCLGFQYLQFDFFDQAGLKGVDMFMADIRS
jgi:hypothetical protein